MDEDEPQLQTRIPARWLPEEIPANYFIIQELGNQIILFWPVRPTPTNEYDKQNEDTYPLFVRSLDEWM